MRRTIIGVLVAGSVIAGPVAIAGAHHSDDHDQPGPNGSNNFGLCTAYFAGSETGRENKRQAPPFQALEEAAEAWSDSEGEEAVREWCEEFGQRPGNV